MTTPLLSISKLRKTFRLHARDVDLTVLDDFSLTLQPGRIHILRGPSGAGKSTVLRCCWRTYLADSGSIAYRCADGSLCDLASADEARIQELRRQEMGFVTQFFRCVPRLACERVVAQPLFDRGIDEAEALPKARAMLDRLHISPSLWHLPPATFSGGEQQRVNLARAFICQHRLLLLDEPTASLDAASRERVLSLLHEARSQGTALLMILHDGELTNRLADEITEVLPVERVAEAG